MDGITPKEDARSVDRADAVPIGKNAKSVRVVESDLQRGSTEGVAQGNGGPHRNRDVSRDDTTLTDESYDRPKGNCLILNRVSTDKECRSTSAIGQQDVEESAVGGKVRAVRDNVMSVDGITPKGDARSVDRADAVPIGKNAKSVRVLESDLQKGSTEGLAQGNGGPHKNRDVWCNAATLEDESCESDRPEANDVNLKAVVDTQAETTVLTKELFYSALEDGRQIFGGTRRNLSVADAGLGLGNDGMRYILGHRQSAMLDVEKHTVKLGRGCLFGELPYIQALEDLCDSEDCFAERVESCKCRLQYGASDGTQLFLGYSEHKNDGSFRERADIPELPTHLQEKRSCESIKNKRGTEDLDEPIPWKRMKCVTVY